jgi:hypothetical protein
MGGAPLTEEQARKAQAQNREFPETMEILSRVRDALAAHLFKTNLSERDAREDIYTRVQALDALRKEMAGILALNASEQAVREYAERIATTDQS